MCAAVMLQPSCHNFLTLPLVCRYTSQSHVACRTDFTVGLCVRACGVCIFVCACVVCVCVFVCALCVWSVCGVCMCVCVCVVCVECVWCV